MTSQFRSLTRQHWFRIFRCGTSRRAGLPPLHYLAGSLPAEYLARGNTAKCGCIGNNYHSCCARAPHNLHCPFAASACPLLWFKPLPCRIMLTTPPKPRLLRPWNRRLVYHVGFSGREASIEHCAISHMIRLVSLPDPVVSCTRQNVE
jgi:hypothetical protein